MFSETVVEDRLKETKGEIVGLCIPYEFDTKYYTAKVDFWLDEIDASNSKETITAYCEQDSQVSQVIDGFVFIFDKSKPSTFDMIHQWVPFLEQSEPGIKLCVGNSSKEPLSMEKDAEINDWCLSHGFDYVDMDETTETPMDKVGMDLTLEILQTNFWDGMVKKKTSTGMNEEEDLIREIQALQLEHHRDILKLDGDEEDEEFGKCIYRYTGKKKRDIYLYLYVEMPSQSEVNKMRDELFGEIDEEDGLDKAFEAIQSMRGICSIYKMCLIKY